MANVKINALPTDTTIADADLTITGDATTGVASKITWLNVWNYIATKVSTITMGAFGSTPNANGATIASGVLNLEPADATHPGGVSTGAQTWAGIKKVTSFFYSGLGTGNAGFIVDRGTTAQSGYLSLRTASTNENRIGLDGGGTDDLVIQNSSYGELMRFGFASGAAKILSLATGPVYSSSGVLSNTAPTTGAIGYWSRSSPVISPTTANDQISVTTNSSNNAITGTAVSGYGVYGVATSGSGVSGRATTGYAFFGRATGASGIGLYADATGAAGTGVYGYANNTGGIGVFGKADDGIAGNLVNNSATHQTLLVEQNGAGALATFANSGGTKVTIANSGAISATAATISSGTDGIIGANRLSSTYAAIHKVSTAGTDNWAFGLPTGATSNVSIFNYGTSTAALTADYTTNAVTIPYGLNGGTAANDDITIQGTTNATRTSSYVLLQPNGGNVGQGTSAPSFADFNASMTGYHAYQNTTNGAGFKAESSNAAIVMVAGNNTGFLYTTTSDPIQFGTNNTAAITLSTAQLVRFNAYGAGTLTTDASGNITATSDERLKNISGFYTTGLSALKQIKPITYKWKTETKLDTKEFYTGFSAQNIHEAIPQAAGKMVNGDLTIQDRPIMATMVNAINELNDIVTKQQEVIKALEARILALEK